MCVYYCAYLLLIKKEKDVLHHAHVDSRKVRQKWVCQ